MDDQNLVFVLGTGIGVPLHVDWVRVWQVGKRRREQ